MQINIRVPGKDEPGFLRRMIRMTELQAEMGEVQAAMKAAGGVSDPTLPARLAAVMNQLVDTITAFATVDNGVNPREALLDLSENEFNRVFAAFQEGAAPGDGPLSAPASDAGSGAG